MGESSVENVMEVLKLALKPDDFHASKAHECKSYNIKLEIMKCGLTKALEELEQQSHLKALYDELHLNSAGSSSGVTKSDTDIRIKFGEMLNFLLVNLAKAIKRKKDSTQRNDICELSLGYMEWVRKAIDLLVNVAVKPYLPEGIDRRIADRFWTSTEWKHILEDKVFQAKQLQTFLTTLFDMMDVAFQVKEFVISRHLNTVIMTAEVLKYLEHTGFDLRYRSFLSEVTASTVFDEATSLINPNAEKFGTNWFNRAMITLMNEMVGRGHLHDLIHAYFLRGLVGEDSIRSMPFVENLVKGLCFGTPHTMTNKEYFSSLINQFFEHLETTPSRKKVVIVMLNLFIDQLFKSHNYLAKTLILDRLLLPLEKLNMGELSEEELRLIPDNIHQLANLFKFARQDLHSKAVIDRIRIRKLHFLLCAIGYEVEENCNLMDDDGKEDGEGAQLMRLVRDDLMVVIRAFMHSLPNQAMFLLWALRQPRDVLRIIEVKTNPKFVTSKIHVMGEKRENPLGRFYFVAQKPSTELETVDCIRRVVIEICRMQKDNMDFYYSGLIEVFKAFINQDGYYNRLADVETAEANHAFYMKQLIELASHLFDNLIEEDENAIDALKEEDTFEKLLNLSILTMTSVVKNMQREVKEEEKEASFDVKMERSAEEKENEEKLRGLIRRTARYGVAFTASIPMLKMIIAPEKMKKLEPEIEQVLRLVALMKKLMGEMKKLPEEYEELNEAITADGLADLTMANAIMDANGKIDVDTDVSFFKTEELVDLLRGMAHEKGQGLIMIGRMLMKRNPRLIEIYDSTFHHIVLDLISNGDSYVYLAAINCAAEAALAMTDKIIPFVQMFARVSSVKEKKNANGEVVSRESIEEKVDVRCRIASVICKVFDGLGSAAPLYMRDSIDSVMECVADIHPLIRASAFAVIEHLFKTFASSYSVGGQFLPIVQSIQNSLLCEKEKQVRRNAIQILPMILRGAGKEMITALSDHLLSINRLLTTILQTENDEVVIKHALLAKEEIKENLKEKLMEEMNNKVREIKM